jgi:excisionase family DNA binding protein
MTVENRLLLRPAEAADAIGVSRARAYELIAAGKIPSIRIGTSIRVPVAALRGWIDAQLAERAAVTTA